jgi:nicotinamidase-related amidase
MTPKTKTSIFVIDIQNDLAGPPTEIPGPDPDTEPKTITTTPIPAAERVISEAETILRDVRDLVARFRARNLANGGDVDDRPPIEIVFVQHEDLPGRGPLRKGSWPWELVSSLRPWEGAGWGEERVVEKRTRMFFFGFHLFLFLPFPPFFFPPSGCALVSVLFFFFSFWSYKVYLPWCQHRRR